MSARLYFAHPIIDYDMPIEAVALIKIEKRFPGFEIINPNTPEHAAAYKARGNFLYWEELAASRYYTVFLCMPGKDRLIGSGVAKEIEAAMAGRGFVYEIDRKTFEISRHPQLNRARVMSVEQTGLMVNMMRDWRLELVGR